MYICMFELHFIFSWDDWLYFGIELRLGGVAVITIGTDFILLHFDGLVALCTGSNSSWVALQLCWGSLYMNRLSWPLGYTCICVVWLFVFWPYSFALCSWPCCTVHFCTWQCSLHIGACCCVAILMCFVDIWTCSLSLHIPMLWSP